MPQEHTLTTASQSESRQGANNAKDILRVDGRDIALGGIGTVNGQFGPGRGDDLLLPGSGKLAQNCLCDCSRRLNGQRVHEHVRRGRHGTQQWS